MPWIVDTAVAEKRKKNSIRVSWNSGAPFGKRRRILIHKQSLRAIAATPLKTGKGCQCHCEEIEISPGDSLFAVQEYWLPGEDSYRNDNSLDYLSTHGWTWRNTAPRDSAGKWIDDLFLSDKVYKKMEAFLKKHIRSEKGAGFRDFVNEAQVPPFIADLFLLHFSETYLKRKNRIYEKGFDYRNVLSPFAKNLLRQAEDQGYLQIKELQQMINGDVAVKTLTELGLLRNIEGLYLVTLDVYREIPIKVNRARKEDPSISLSDLSRLTGLPKKIVITLLREADE